MTGTGPDGHNASTDGGPAEETPHVAGPDLPSNWGRWGDHDQLGTLNLIDDAARARAVKEVRSGRLVSLARPVAPVSFAPGRGPVGSATVMPTAVMQTMNFGGTQPMAMTDILVLNVHNAAMTHLDALAHIPVDGKVYPGIPLDDAVTAQGVQHGSIDSTTGGILTRGVLLDVAPNGGSLDAAARIGAADLDRALERSGATLTSGDAVAVRGGWDTNLPLNQPVPGLDLTAVRWLHSRGVSVYLGDIGDSRPPTFPLPMHQVALARLGMTLVDAAALDDLADACRAEHRSTFLLILAPPRITGTTGLPVNPIALL